MNILVTGAGGFVGRNLVENLKNIRDGKNRTRPDITIDAIYEYDISSKAEELEEYCQKADFVFNLAGVNRPKDPEEFRKGNFGFASTLLETLKRHGNKAPVMLSSSIQATLAGRFGTSDYGLSKREGEELFFQYAEETGAEVFVYRFPNLAGKWIRPNYNSAVGTFCYNIANDLPITVNDPKVELELLFIDDLLEEMYNALEGHPHRAEYPLAGTKIEVSSSAALFDGLTPLPKENGRYCYVPLTHKVTLGRIVELLYEFHDQPSNLIIPSIPEGSFEKKLYSMYLSYLPKEKVVFDLKMNCDERGSFTELLKTTDHGQFSVNISRPGITKGQHWHNSKWEFFIVVAGHGLIQERKIGTDPDTGKPFEPIEFEVFGGEYAGKMVADRKGNECERTIQAVHMLPGYTHNIINLSDTENLVTVMWANELFDPEKPDTYFEKV
ncbi:MAG: NAD-dependent epimerase/dehydratase family protein [Parasporobacterium sp.]|nr:NAD-dependent epimerase/dehydratase family protein [Parasporobacterium sp.]